MKELKRDKNHPLFLQIANELGRLRLRGYKPNRLLINKRFEYDFVNVDGLIIFNNVEILFTEEKFDFSFEQVIETFKFRK